MTVRQAAVDTTKDKGEKSPFLSAQRLNPIKFPLLLTTVIHYT